jgi:hypothetical protein
MIYAHRFLASAVLIATKQHYSEEDNCEYPFKNFFLEFIFLSLPEINLCYYNLEIKFSNKIFANYNIAGFANPVYCFL